jgi:hypothetical protein
MTLGGKLGIYIDYILGGQIWKTIHEKSQRTLDSVVQLNALGFANAPPTSGHGDTYIVGTAPTGAFAGQAAGVVATYHSTLSSFEFYPPQKGWRGYIGNDMYYYNASSWVLESSLLAFPTNVLVLIDGNLDATDVLVPAPSTPITPSPSLLVDGGII